MDATTWLHGKKDWADVPVAEVVIEDHSWIGTNVIILKGTRVGVGAVVGAGSVVTRHVEPYTLVAGNPARPLRDLPR